MEPLTTLYVELTTGCNLNCQMCVRHAWQDIHGTMALDTFRRLVEEVAGWAEPPVLHLGGYGEPMTHPHFLECVKLAKEAGLRVEVTTNGTLLNRIICLALLDLGLDRLVVSIDSVDPAQNDDLRTGVCTDDVLDNLHELQRLRQRPAPAGPGLEVNLAFVAMRHNLDSMTRLPELARAVGASRVIVSNLIAHSAELESEILYEGMLRDTPDPTKPEISLPRLDPVNESLAAASDVLRSGARISLLGQPVSGHPPRCPYAHEGRAAVRWDGAVSPCLSLLHDHPEYRLGQRVEVHEHTLGNINFHPLADIWNDAAFADLRVRLRAGDFSACPCSDPPGGVMVDAEAACGDCLWARGLVQVP